MFYGVNYAQPLRTIGQALEILRIGTFDIVSEGDDYLVRGDVTVPTAEAVRKRLQEANLEYIWGKVSDRSGNENSSAQTAASRVALELRYTAKDVERLEGEGRARRSDAHGMPDASSLPQLLRAVGAYVNQKGARFVKLTRQDQSMIVQYESAAGQQSAETFTVSGLYDVWVRMYMRRATRDDTEYH